MRPLIVGAILSAALVGVTVADVLVLRSVGDRVADDAYDACMAVEGFGVWEPADESNSHAELARMMGEASALCHAFADAKRPWYLP